MKPGAAERAAGLLLHPTSLPGSYGMGEIGDQALQWVGALRAAGQRVWQILPMGPTGYGDSPYQSFSAFAGNPLWIAFDGLLRDGWLAPGDLAGFPVFDAGRIDFGPVIEARGRILRLACDRFGRRGGRTHREAAARFFRRQAHWLEDFALFTALKAEQAGRPWTEWPAPLRDREPAALASARRRLRREVVRVRIEQYFFDRQWRALRARARRSGVVLFGDLPLFVAHDSADVWSHPGLFRLEPDGRPSVVAGVPPDYFSSTGQRWGHPHYRWEAHAAEGFGWWIRRMRAAFERLDRVRLDHFLGLVAGWEIPASEPSAVHGRWRPGPGAALLEAVFGGCPRADLVAEDLGRVTPEAEALRRAFGLPGMLVLQFLFGDDQTARRAASLARPDRVVYTGTHDNDTVAGWFRSPPGAGGQGPDAEGEAGRKRVLRAVRTRGREIHWDLIRFAWRTRARLAIAPLQDVLGLDSRARMNRPGTGEGNWAWRFTWEQFAPALRLRLRALTEAAGRAPPGGRAGA